MMFTIKYCYEYYYYYHYYLYNIRLYIFKFKMINKVAPSLDEVHIKGMNCYFSEICEVTPSHSKDIDSK